MTVSIRGRVSLITSFSLISLHSANRSLTTNFGAHSAFTRHYSSDISGLTHVEDDDGQIIVHAQGDG
jgi:hypothetical protein